MEGYNKIACSLEHYQGKDYLVFEEAFEAGLFEALKIIL